MSHLHDKVFGNSWVGIIVWDTRVEFISVTVNDQTITADLPARHLFRIPVEITEENSGKIVWQLRLSPNRIFTCLQSRHQGGIDSTCWSSDKEDGHLAHYRTVEVERGQFSQWMGYYKDDQQASWVIGQDSRPMLPLFFYEHNNELVRLYPISSKKFISERGEWCFFEQDGLQPYLTIDSRFHEAKRLERTTPYQEERVLIPTADGHVLGASLILPNSPAPHPAVLFCHYADTHFRDYYRLFAEYFLRQGIATLIYDKRGWGDSTGESLFSSIFPLADDAVAVYQFLESHPAIQSNGIGFWGASNGAWVAPLAASRVNHPAFVIAVSSAGVTPAYQEQVRRVNIVRALGASPEAVTLLDRMWHLLMDFLCHRDMDRRNGFCLTTSLRPCRITRLAQTKRLWTGIAGGSTPHSNRRIAGNRRRNMDGRRL
jgi:hypothetical protein